jgi:hypothetical protein
MLCYVTLHCVILCLLYYIILYITASCGKLNNKSITANNKTTDFTVYRLKYLVTPDMSKFKQSDFAEFILRLML